MLAITRDADRRRSPSPARRVLVIEPYASGRRAICACIVELGHEALEVETLDAARILAASSGVDLVIAAWDDDDSRAVLDALRAGDPELPTVVLSDCRPRVATGPAGAMLLVKPFTLVSLERAIELMARPRAAPIIRS